MFALRPPQASSRALMPTRRAPPRAREDTTLTPEDDRDTVTTPTTPTPTLAEKLAHFYSSELTGALAVARMLRLAEDDDTRAEMTRHMADEARHAAMWAEVMCELDVPIPTNVEVDSFQTYLRHDLKKRPRTLGEWVATSLAVERVGLAAYEAELAQEAELPASVVAVLRTLIADERWHLAWSEATLWRLSEDQPGILPLAREADEAAQRVAARLLHTPT